LAEHGLRSVYTPGDGDCFLHAVNQMRGFARLSGVDILEQRGELVNLLVSLQDKLIPRDDERVKQDTLRSLIEITLSLEGETWDAYLVRMRRLGGDKVRGEQKSWCDGPMMLAVAIQCRRRIEVISSTGYNMVVPNFSLAEWDLGMGPDPIVIGHEAGVDRLGLHYVATEPIPTEEQLTLTPNPNP
jgi:hypothetical protein